MKKSKATQKILLRIAIAIGLVLLAYVVIYILACIMIISAVSAVYEYERIMTSEQALIYIMGSEDIKDVISVAASIIAFLPALVVFIKESLKCWHYISDIKKQLQRENKVFTVNLNSSTKRSNEEVKREKEEADEMEYKMVLIKMPYKRKSLLTGPEKDLWKVLRETLPKDLTITAKPGLKEFISTPNYESGCINQRAWREIAQKHVDFLVCNPNMYPLFAIEYDGDTHNPNNPQNAATVRNDEFKNRLFTYLGIPLIRIEYGPKPFLEFQIKKAFDELNGSSIQNGKDAFK